MAHNLDETTGRPAIAYVGETERIWHKLGERLPENQPIEVWLKAARLEWQLERLPVQFLIDGRMRTMDDRFVLARSDSKTGLSVVSGDYHIVQPKEVLEFYRDLIKDYKYKLDTAGALDGGRKVWALARTDKTELAANNSEDELAAYLLLATSCDKTLATTVAFTCIRVVCQNTLFFAKDDIAENKRKQMKIPHSLRFSAPAIKEKLGLIDNAWDEFIKNVRAMANKRINPPEAATFFEDLLRPQDGKKLSVKGQREMEAIASLYLHGDGQELDTAKGTLWGAVNAVTNYVDHSRPSTAVDRLDSAWFGSGCALKDKAWNLAMERLPPRA